MQFTEKFIQALKPKNVRYDVREKSGNGFAIRITTSGEKSWVFFYMFEGKKKRLTLGSYPALSLGEARTKHRDALKLLAHGKDPSAEKRKDKVLARDAFTVEDLIKEYIAKWAKPRKRSWQEDERVLNKDVKSLWGKRKAKDITRRDIILLIDKIKDRGAPIAANRALACVRRMFNFAVERDIISISPCVLVKAVAKENRRDRVLSIDEIKNFWNDLSGNRKLDDDRWAIVISQGARLALKLQLVTAQRKGEIISAEWSEIDYTGRCWTIPAIKAKNGQTHRVPLSKLALELLKEIKELSGDSRWLFPSDKTDKHIMSASIDHAIRRSAFNEIKPFTPHDLRRTAASHMTSIGISRLVVSKILNHVESSVTAIYDRHSYDAEKLNALNTWGKKLIEIVNGSGTKMNVIEFKKVI